MKYSITLKKQAIKTLEKIDEPYYSNIKVAIYDLAVNPYPLGCKKLKGRDSYCVRVSNYRIIYDILNEDLIIDVIDIGHRKDIYN